MLEITKKQYYFDGKITKVEEISRKVIEEPVDTIIQVGTKKKEQPASSIEVLNYKKKITILLLNFIIKITNGLIRKTKA